MSKAAPNPDGLLSIADISRHFSLPESTTRYYCKRFSLYIPSVGDGRRKRYRRETLDVISIILEHMEKSRTASAVEEALQERFPSNAVALAEAHPVEPAQTDAVGSALSAAALQFMERQTRAMENIAHVMGLMAERLQALPAQDRAELPPAALDAEQQKMRKDLDNLKILLDSAEKTQQADLEQLRQWMGRLVQQRLTAGGE